MIYKTIIKRLIDIILSLLSLIVLSPVLIVIVFLLLITGENEVFYFQERIGFKNKKFKIWKFATMLKNSSKFGAGMYTTRKDPRVLPVGVFLRKTKINELPQLINVFLGDMSIVGPRPLTESTFTPYSDEIKKCIYNVKPGLTGTGSVFFRDEEELLSNTDMPLAEYYKMFISPYKGALEIWYQKNISFYTDFMLIFLTVWVVVFPNSNLMFNVFNDLPKKKI